MNKIFAIGPHKTGTSSLAEALTQLGIKTTHWMHHEEIFKGIVKKDFHFKFLDEFDAVCDLPIPVIYKELDAAYPGSKFIHTVRDETAWLKSVVNHMDGPGVNVDGYQLRRLEPEEFLFYGVWYYEKEVFLRKYREHNAQVSEYFRDRRDQYLKIDITKENERHKLYDFLNMKARSEEFPHVYKGEYVKKKINFKLRTLKSSIDKLLK